MSLNNLKSAKSEKIDWLELSSQMTQLSKSLRSSSKDEIKDVLIYMIHKNIIIAKDFNIDMDEAWNKWSKKAISKIYL